MGPNLDQESDLLNSNGSGGNHFDGNPRLLVEILGFLVKSNVKSLDFVGNPLDLQRNRLDFLENFGFWWKSKCFVGNPMDFN